MDKLRLKFIFDGHAIKLTPKESKNIGNIHTLLHENSSWLMQDRGELQWTHPDYPGPFTKEKVRWYHYYCSLEMWETLGNMPNHHWVYGDNTLYGIEPFICYIFLPIAQRKIVWDWAYHTEIFNDLLPFYRHFFAKN